MPTINGIRECKNCHALYYNNDKFKGLCPSNGGNHKKNPQFNFLLTYGYGGDTGTTQVNWHRCRVCQAIVFPRGGKCDGSDRHTVYTGDYNFALPHDLPVNTKNCQRGWEFCLKCNALFRGGLSTPGNCAAGGDHQQHPDAFRFVLFHEPA